MPDDCPSGTEEYNSVVVDKGAMVFHMLRAQLGDANFFALLKGIFIPATPAASLRASMILRAWRWRERHKRPRVDAAVIGNAPLSGRGNGKLALFLYPMAALDGRSRNFPWNM